MTFFKAEHKGHHKLINKDELAHLLGVKVEVVDKLVREKLIPYMFFDKKIRFYYPDVMDALPGKKPSTVVRELKESIKSMRHELQQMTELQTLMRANLIRLESTLEDYLNDKEVQRTEWVVREIEEAQAKEKKKKVKPAFGRNWNPITHGDESLEDEYSEENSSEESEEEYSEEEYEDESSEEVQPKRTPSKLIMPSWAKTKRST